AHRGHVRDLERRHLAGSSRKRRSSAGYGGSRGTSAERAKIGQMRYQGVTVRSRTARGAATLHAVSATPHATSATLQWASRDSGYSRSAGHLVTFRTTRARDVETFTKPANQAETSASLPYRKHLEA